MKTCLWECILPRYEGSKLLKSEIKPEFSRKTITHYPVIDWLTSIKLWYFEQWWQVHTLGLCKLIYVSDVGPHDEKKTTPQVQKGQQWSKARAQFKLSLVTTAPWDKSLSFLNMAAYNIEPGVRLSPNK